MKSAFRIICLTALVVLALVITSACVKHPPAAENVPQQPAPEANNEAKKTVVAKVNGTELYMDDLISMMNRLGDNSVGGVPESPAEHKKRAMDKLVLQELAYQQAKATGITITPQKIDLAITNLKENIGGEQEYASYLAKKNVTEAELRTEVERRLLIELDYSREVLAKVNVPDEEVRQEYEKVKQLYIMPEKVSIIDVWVLKNEGKASQDKARELLKKIKANADKNPWSLTLDGSFIIRDLKVRKDTYQELYLAAKKLKPGELSGVITTPNDLHIIKLKEYSPERQATFDEVKEQVGLKFKIPAQEKRLQEWEQELKTGAKIELMDIPIQQQVQKETP